MKPSEGARPSHRRQRDTSAESVLIPVRQTGLRERFDVAKVAGRY